MRLGRFVLSDLFSSLTTAVKMVEYLSDEANSFFVFFNYSVRDYYNASLVCVCSVLSKCAMCVLCAARW